MSLHVGADLLAQIRDFVDEGDLGGEEGVGGVFDQLGRAPADIHDRRGIEIERAVDFREHLARARVVAADHDAVGMLEILDRRAFAQEFGVGHDLHVGLGAQLPHDALDLVAGADRNGRFGDHDRGRRQQGRDLAHRLVNEAQIGVAVAAARRGADRDEHGIGPTDAVVRDRKLEPAAADVAFNKLAQPGLEDRNLAAGERRDLGGILVDADHVVAEIGETGAGNKPHIAGADHRHMHGYPCSLSERSIKGVMS